MTPQEIEEIRRGDIRGQVELPYANRDQCMDALVYRLLQPELGLGGTACVVRQLQADVKRLLEHVDALTKR
jgi:hypothetical protein